MFQYIKGEIFNLNFSESYTFALSEIHMYQRQSYVWDRQSNKHIFSKIDRALVVEYINNPNISMIQIRSTQSISVWDRHNPNIFFVRSYNQNIWITKIQLSIFFLSKRFAKIN